MMALQRKPVLVVGAGCAGASAARFLADAGLKVEVLDSRGHVGGNAYETEDAHGALIHPYGPHIFHTNSQMVVDFLSRFTRWRPYEHRSLSEIDSGRYIFPLNLSSLNAFFGMDLDAPSMQRWLDNKCEEIATPSNAREYLLAQVGELLFEAFFEGYIRRFWDMDASELDVSTVARVAPRLSHDSRYFLDRHQMMPADGYHPMFQRMLDHPNIRVHLNETYERTAASHFQHVVYTGPVAEWFGWSEGPLPYRSVRFAFEHRPGFSSVQEVGSINYPGARDYTRVSDFSHITGQAGRGATLVREYACAEGIPFYPIPTRENATTYARYRKLASRAEGVTFVGRLAEYRYYNMDQTIAAGLAAARRLVPALV